MLITRYSLQRFMISAALFLVAALSTLTSSATNAQSVQKSEDDRRSAANNYGFTKEVLVDGWSAQTDFDISQEEDRAVPVVVAGISSYAGKGKWRRYVMVESVVLKNRSDRTVKSVKFGWILIADVDRRAGKNREAAISNGYTETFDISITPGAVKRVDDVHLDVVKEAHESISRGAIIGTFFLRIRVAEIKFVDGSIWVEQHRQAQHSQSNGRSPFGFTSASLCPTMQTR